MKWLFYFQPHKSTSVALKNLWKHLDSPLNYAPSSRHNGWQLLSRTVVSWHFTQRVYRIQVCMNVSSQLYFHLVLWHPNWTECPPLGCKQRACWSPSVLFVHAKTSIYATATQKKSTDNFCICLVKVNNYYRLYDDARERRLLGSACLCGDFF